MPRADLTRATRVAVAAFSVIGVPWYGPPAMAVIRSHGWLQALIGAAVLTALWLWFTRSILVALPPSPEVRDEARRRAGE